MPEYLPEAVSISIMMLFAQNLLFTGTYGLSRLMEVVEKPRKLLRFGAVVTVFCTLSSLLAVLFSPLFPDSDLGNAFFGVLCAAIIALLYLAAFISLKLLKKINFLKVLFLGALNSAVLIVPIAARHLKLDVLDALCLGLFSGLGFTLGAILLQSGFKSLSQNHVPRSFRGMPIKLLYAALLSMAFMGFTGQFFNV